MALGDLSSREKPLDLGNLGPELIRLQQRSHDGPSAAAFDIRQIGGKVGAEDEHAVARIEKRLAKKLLEDLGPRSSNDICRLGRNVELALHESGGGLAEFGNPRRRAVMRLVLLDGLHAGRLGRCRAVKGAVADLEFHNILAGGL